MGKVTLDEKFKSYTGIVPPKGHRFYLTNRYGQTIISHCPTSRDPSTITDKQKASSSLHTKATTLADAALKDPVQHDEWLHKWHEHSALCASRSPHRPKKHYKTLRGFVIAVYRQQL